MKRTLTMLCDEHEQTFLTVPVTWDTANIKLYAQAVSYTG